MKGGAKMRSEEIEEIVESLYKKYSTQIITTLLDKGILFESECGFGGPVIEFGANHLEYLFKKDDINLSLGSGCYLNGGDSLYYIYNKELFDMEDACANAKVKYEQNRIQ